jgi:ATP-dependent Lon protease
VLPEGNRQDVLDMPPKLRRGLRFVFARTMDEVLAVALVPQGDLLALSPAGRGQR